ncbi:MAG TPA: hypothetical protein DHU59_08200 [Clostridiales bacterium]|nr:hypothetical protein [Clostridiales bacterium]
MKERKRVFGLAEVYFDVIYMSSALSIGIYLVTTGHSQVKFLTGITSLLLVGGDAFHLIPRIVAILTAQEHKFVRAMGIGKLITSVTMTIFYILLWEIGIMLFSPHISSIWKYIIYGLATIRILLCLFPQNRWLYEHPPVIWGIYRNIPFLMLGAAVMILFGSNAVSISVLSNMWLAIALSFAFYIPVVMWSGTNSKIGMLMLPKTCAYLWMLIMFMNL